MEICRWHDEMKHRNHLTYDGNNGWDSTLLRIYVL